MTPGDICGVCKRAFWREQCGDVTLEWCSEFCARMPERVLAKFATLQPGDFGIWPCAGCGEPVDDEYHPGAICGECAPKVRARKMETLLREVAAGLREILATAPAGSTSEVVGEKLLAKAEEALR